MSKIIIGIHGLGNKPPEKLLKKWWRMAIQEGLQARGHPWRSFNFELVYWAHFLHPNSLNPHEKNEKDPLFVNDPYVPAKNFDVKKPSKLRKKLLHYLEKQTDKIFLNEDMSINFSSISDLIIRHFFKDLEFYYSSTCIDDKNKERPAKEVIRERLTQLLEKHKRKDILLIAHSMGSIIAYDVLNHSSPGIKVDTFVTIGSPLGLPIIMSKIIAERDEDIKFETKVRTPESIKRNWYNFSDLEDKVAINYDLADDYDENSNHVRAIDKVVYNNYEHNKQRNPHKSYGYLRTLELADVIHNFLNYGRNRVIIWLTNKLKLILKIVMPI